MASKYTLDVIIPNCTDRVSIPAEYKDTFQKIIAFCKKSRGGNVRMRISPPVKKRTTGEFSQNHHINGHCQQLANTTGEDFDEIKRHVKITAIKYGYEIRTNVFGEAVPISEADCDTINASYLIEAAHEIADFLNVELIEEKQWTS